MGRTHLRRGITGFAAAYGLVLLLHAVAHYLGWSLWSRGGAVAAPWVVLSEACIAFLAVLLLATAVVPLGFVARMLQSARVRAGHADPMAGARLWLDAHPKLTRVLTALPLAMLAVGLWGFVPGWQTASWVALSGMLPVLLAAHASGLGLVGLRALLAPPVEASEPPRADVGADQITFDAVAVTLETRAAVAGMALLPLAMIAFANALTARGLSGDSSAILAILLYVLAAASGAALFRRTSRIAVGLDGVLVAGSSRTRFLAYRDLDEARVHGGDLELLQGTHVATRLQLHGRDASRRDALLERIRGAIARAKKDRTVGTADFVSSASKETLTRAARGAGDYRAAAICREQLWALVEGPAIDGATRRTAADALVKSGDEGERARLRVAAEQTANPEVRVALAKLAEELEDTEAELVPRQRARSR